MKEQIFILHLIESDDCTYAFHSYKPVKGFTSKEQLGVFLLNQIAKNSWFKIGNTELCSDHIVEDGEDIMQRISTLDEWIEIEGIKDETFTD